MIGANGPLYHQREADISDGLMPAKLSGGNNKTNSGEFRYRLFGSDAIGSDCWGGLLHAVNPKELRPDHIKGRENKIILFLKTITPYRL